MTLLLLLFYYSIFYKLICTGLISVNYIDTHVGHNNEVRTQRLSKDDKHYLLSQLKAGVSTDRIIKNARELQQDNEPSKLNLITRKDLNNLARINNVDNIRHSNDMIATAMKVKEWNSDGKNYAFLFKQIGKFTVKYFWF